MPLDKHTLQKWVVGSEIRFQKTGAPFAKVPLLNRISKVAAFEQAYTLAEKIDLTRAADFQVQESAEDFLVASIELPILGKRGVGNDSGLAVATFNYTDNEGDPHRVIAICAYAISGVVKKTRELKQTILIPVV